MKRNGPKIDHLEWSDLRVALILGREGSVRRAARALGVSHSTILRRLGALERAVGAELFLNKANGYEATAAGQDVIDTAAGLDESINGLERRVAGRDVRLVGEVRVTLPDPFAPILVPVLKEIAAANPGIELTVGLSTSYADMAHRDADVAVRTAEAPPPDLIGRRVGVAAIGIYGAAAYLAGRNTDDLESLDWVGWEKGSTMWFARWMGTHVPNARVALRVSAAWGLREGVDAGAGVAIVPCALGEARPDWKRIKLVPEGSTPLWILTHRDLRNAARVRAVSDLLAAAIRERKDAFEGRRSSARDRRSGRRREP